MNKALRILNHPDAQSIVHTVSIVSLCATIVVLHRRMEKIADSALIITKNLEERIDRLDAAN